MPEWTSTIDFTGVEAAVSAAAERAVARGGALIQTESLRVVPSEDGTLARSSTVTTERQGDVATAAVAYDTAYAVRQHEDLDQQHDPGRGPKYLEGPALAAAGEVLGIAAEELGRVFR